MFLALRAFLSIHAFLALCAFLPLRAFLALRAFPALRALLALLAFLALFERNNLLALLAPRALLLLFLFCDMHSCAIFSSAWTHRDSPSMRAAHMFSPLAEPVRSAIPRLHFKHAHAQSAVFSHYSPP